ncbi:hypothetical protein HOM50_04240 [bacterium]|jgi:hypothetical protein|nr:hypothetical protein [bacterium]MBT5015588.1 hypothetical protein [bacterium]
MKKTLLVLSLVLYSTVYTEVYRIYITNNTQEVIPHVRIKVQKKGWNKTYQRSEHCYGSVHIDELKSGHTQSVVLENATKRLRSFVHRDPKYPFRDHWVRGGRKENEWYPLGMHLENAQIVPLGIIVDTASGCPGGCRVTRKGKCAERHDNAEYHIGADPTANSYSLARKDGRVVVKAAK